jgi:hypothetical protein
LEDRWSLVPVLSIHSCLLGSLLLSFLLIFFLIHSSSVKCTELVEHVKLWQCVCIELEATIDLSHFNVAFKL